MFNRFHERVLIFSLHVRFKFQKTGNSIGHNVEPVWEKGFTGKNITVAVVDDGLKFTHEEFKNRYVSN